MREVPKRESETEGCVRQLPRLKDAPSQLSQDNLAGRENDEGSRNNSGDLTN